jgi:hypothetical protein
MVKKAAVILSVLMFAGYAGAGDGDTLARFEGAIGVIPVSNAAGAPNVVRGVNPPGQIWRIDGLRAVVDSDGRIRVRGRGLLLGGGNNIGRNANASVIATLICEAAAPFVLRNTAAAGVPLALNGDFRIDDTLDPAPGTCASPLLLIRSTGGAWFAAGIQKLVGDDD